jgi:1-deoxy-D-xylulose-5-phosphate reductoisomerase
MIDYITPLENISWPAFPRTLTILGATGSIGTSALKVVEQHPDSFRVLALTGGRNIDKLARQAARFRPEHLAVLDEAGAQDLRERLPADYAPNIMAGPEAFVELAGLAEADVVLSAIVGAAGLPPTLRAVRAGKVVALANKESIVLAGGLIRKAAREHGAAVLPVDSEHNALFQCMAGEEPRTVAKLLLTASGGPFRGRPAAELESVTREQALAHPNWSMGAKISIDSATLMNKGLEYIEACRLFGIGPEEIEVVVHPQSIIHSMVQYVDGSVLAHLGPPDMQVAIAHAMAYPTRRPLDLEPVDFVALGSLTFERPDIESFPCLALAQQAFAAGESHPIVLNAANEIAVERFLAGGIGFMDIPRLVRDALESHPGGPADELEHILDLDRRAREDSASRAQTLSS